jgi:hypothetical protein
MFEQFPTFFHTNISLFIIILVSLMAAGLAFYQYRRTIPPVSKNLRIFLALLRGITMAFILVLLFAPEITAIWQVKEKARVALLIDRSASMGIKEGDNNRLKRAISAAEKLSATIQNRVDLVMYAFDTDTLRLSDLQIDTTQLGTNIEKALTNIIRKQTSAADIVLITDGNFTVGDNPLYAERQNQIRVFSVGIGDSVESIDLVITDVKTNKIIYHNQPTEIQASLMLRGSDNQTLRLRLMQERRVLQAKELQSGRRDELHTVPFQIIPEKTGPQQFKIEAETLSGESLTKNNSFTFSIDVLKDKIHVVLLSGKPGYENRFLQSTLSQLKEIDLKTSVFKGNDQYYLNQAEKIVDSADVLILENFPGQGRIGPADFNILRKALSNRTPSLIILGEYPASQTLSLIKEWFPLTSLQKSTAPLSIQVRLAAEGRSLPLLSIFNSEDEENKFWKEIPPLVYRFLDVEFEDAARALLVSSRSAKNNDRILPVICSYSAKGRRSLLFLGSGFWRWAFMTAESRTYQDSWQQILKNMIRWLDSETANKNVILTTPQKNREIGTEVKLQTQVYDLAYQPLNEASVKTIINGPTSSFELESAFSGNGNYETSFIPADPGNYIIKAEAWRNDVRIGEDKLIIPILPVNQEFIETTQNVQLLKKLAAKNGGHYVRDQQIEELIPMIRTETISKQKQETVEIWNRLPVLLTIIGLLCVEWFIRKRKGLA